MTKAADDKKTDDGNCLAEPFLKFFAQEWMSHVIAALARNGTLRFGQLRRAMPGAITPRVLSARLKELEGAGYVSRRVLDGRVKHVEYTLTDSGRVIDALLARTEAAASSGGRPRA